jgi:GDPmannose 4,6-dehydratase
MQKALITGITGQDGSYMAELLLDKDYVVVGAVRDIQKSKEALPRELLNYVELVEWDMLDQQRMKQVLEEHRPDELYNFAAYSSGSGMFDDPVGIGDVNGLAVTRILEAIRALDKQVRFCQASSSEIFGDVLESPQSESTICRPRSPYGAAKLYAHSMIRVYRQRYGLYGCSAILFNHESPRRNLGFVTRKITHEAVKIKLGLADKLYLGNLDACRDWGFSGDYVRAMWLMLQQPQADDYVLATGVTHSVRDLCEIAFRYLGLNYQDYVKVDVSSFRSSEAVQLVGNPSKAASQLGWVNELDFRELVCMMVDADLKLRGY